MTNWNHQWFRAWSPKDIDGVPLGWSMRQAARETRQGIHSKSMGNLHMCIQKETGECRHKPCKERKVRKRFMRRVQKWDLSPMRHYIMPCQLKKGDGNYIPYKENAQHVLFQIEVINWKSSLRAFNKSLEHEIQAALHREHRCVANTTK